MILNINSSHSSNIYSNGKICPIVLRIPLPLKQKTCSLHHVTVSDFLCAFMEQIMLFFALHYIQSTYFDRSSIDKLAQLFTASDPSLNLVIMREVTSLTRLTCRSIADCRELVLQQLARRSIFSAITATEY